MHATLTAVANRLYLFGGTAEVEQPSTSFYLNDLFVFDATFGDWSDELSRPWCCERNVVVVQSKTMTLCEKRNFPRQALM